MVKRTTRLVRFRRHLRTLSCSLNLGVLGVLAVILPANEANRSNQTTTNNRARL